MTSLDVTPIPRALDSVNVYSAGESSGRDQLLAHKSRTDRTLAPSGRQQLITAPDVRLLLRERIGDTLTSSAFATCPRVRRRRD
ncbi:hypothetical protein EVAR_100426_1 [Eumeta japonica]|uniref:Uncharacterized protein n=1 Tax=Eumeta variegata TaxID=151549 RepID=A0A4C2A9C6_EUMVA|nr:hypothetical protein EVAR_100426_1 [Eumeta japonica]